MSGLMSCRNGLRSAASMSMPLARASISARSCIVTISWSRSCGFSSRSHRNAIRNTTMLGARRRSGTRASRTACCGPRVGMVMVPTTETIRLPSTGPLVQKPIAVARPTCGEKSRISAGVATRQMPSTKPTMKPSIAKDHLLRRQRQDELHEHGGEEQAEDHQVGPAEPVGEARRSREPKAPTRLPRAGGDREERERHACRLVRMQRGDRAADVELVVERDRGEHRDRQVAHPGPGCRIVLKLTVDQPDPAGPCVLSLSGRGHRLAPFRSASATGLDEGMPVHTVLSMC